MYDVYQELRQQAISYIQEVEKQEQERASLLLQIKELQEKQAALEPKIDLFERERVVLQTLAKATRDSIMDGLEQIVTLCLQAVFGPHLSFEIDVESKRNNTAVEFFVVNTEGEEPLRLVPEEAMGGGVVDVVSFGLRFGLLKVLSPEPEGQFFLDEPAKMVSGDKVSSVGQLMKELCSMLKRQVNIVTHHEVFTELADNVIYIRMENGISIVEEWGA